MPLNLTNARRAKKFRRTHDEAGRTGHLKALPEHAWYPLCKAVTEFIVALSLIVLAAPFILISALLVKWTSRGPAFYSQTRLGRYGVPYTIYKVRTMIHQCESQTGPLWSTAGDPRVTRVGRVLRFTHLDELPQLWNVLRGDMSLVGPRPERPEFVPELEHLIPHYRQRLAVRPGVTGLAQVQLPADSGVKSVRRKLAYDLYYVQRMSPGLDLRILLSTVFKMLGFSFPVLRRVFLMPSCIRVARNYRQFVARWRSHRPGPAGLASCGHGNQA